MKDNGSYQWAYKQLVAKIQGRLEAYKLDPTALASEKDRARHEALHDVLQDAKEIERRYL